MRFFREAFIELIANQLSTKTASEIATSLASNFITPLYSQIDPMRVAEIERAIKIALAYGERLIEDNRGNIKGSTQLVDLIRAYPDHGFVIDFKEAKKIFKKIRKCTSEEEAFGKQLKKLVYHPDDSYRIAQKIFPREEQSEINSKSEGVESARRAADKTVSTDKKTSARIVPISEKHNSTKT
jgi:hypothetical protein